ncbi:alpha/beta hydrolase [Longispora albida]|uniref:alpha/beta hydrolase n=1 Tax=Longispora albida TaxID=203523 RepID=UPI000367E7A9|nr:alpha/beta hydrolase [Longispora albida]
MKRALTAIALIGLLAGCTEPAAAPKSQQQTQPQTQSTLPDAHGSQPPKPADRSGALPGHAFAGCVTSADGAPIEGVKGATMGKGTRAVVFSNTADGNGCDWVAYGKELTAKGYQVAVWNYGSKDNMERVAELKLIIGKLRAGGAQKIVLAGGSRGACLSVIVAAETDPAVQGVAALSCAKVYNRDNPVEMAPYVAKLKVPAFYAHGEKDGTPLVSEVRAEFNAITAPGKKLVIVPGSGAHGDLLLGAGTVKADLTAFFDRVTA